jgi:hypothetical protein
MKGPEYQDISPLVLTVFCTEKTDHFFQSVVMLVHEILDDCAPGLKSFLKNRKRRCDVWIILNNCLLFKSEGHKRALKQFML